MKTTSQLESGFADGRSGSDGIATFPEMRWILVVEDDEEIRNSLVEILTEEGYPVQSAINGKVALEVLQRLRNAGTGLPDLIILDLMMPVMGGFAFMDQQRQDPRLVDIPVLVMSADRVHTNMLTGTDTVHIINKPPTLESLLSAVGSLWRRS